MPFNGTNLNKWLSDLNKLIFKQLNFNFFSGSSIFFFSLHREKNTIFFFFTIFWDFSTNFGKGLGSKVQGPSKEFKEEEKEEQSKEVSGDGGEGELGLALLTALSTFELSSYCSHRFHRFYQLSWPIRTVIRENTVMSTLDLSSTP